MWISDSAEVQNVFEIVEVSLFLLVYLIYHAVYVWLYFKKPESVGLALNLAERKLWIGKTLDPSVNDTIGVQSIRNALMTATFFSTSSLLVAYGSISDILASRRATDVAFTPLQIKALCLSAIFFSAFLFFAFSVRSFFHLTFLVNSKAWIPIPTAPPRSRRSSAAAASSSSSSASPSEISISLGEAPSTPSTLTPPASPSLLDPSPLRPQTPQFWSMPDLHADEETGQFLPSSALILLSKPRTEEQALESNNQIMVRATVAWWLGMRCFYTAVPLGLWLLGFPGLFVGTSLAVGLFLVNDYF